MDAEYLDNVVRDDAGLINDDDDDVGGGGGGVVTTMAARDTSAMDGAILFR